MNQLVPVPVGTLTFSAGSGQSLNFDRALSQLGGRLAHMRKLTFQVRATPTLTSGNATIEELQAAIKNLTIKDGVRKIFEGSFKSLRLFEALERGRLASPEPDAASTTEQVNFTRTFDLALPACADPNDFLMPVAAFKGGSINVSYGALTDVDAQCTALTFVVDVFAWVTILDDLIIPSLLERFEQNVVNSQAINTEALYAFLALCDSNAFGALTAGDIGNIQILNEAFSTEKIDVRALRDAYYADMEVGGLSQVAGEPRAATDDNAKVISATALAAPTANMQPIVWNPTGGRISKLVHQARPGLTLNWDGSQGTCYGLMSRIVPRTTDLFAKYLGVIRSALPIDPSKWELRDRTLTKKGYSGPRREYLPVKLKAPGV